MSLVTQSVRVYAEAAFARVGHLRTRDSNYPREADLVVVTTGDIADRRADGIAVVPLALLGP